MAYYILLTQEVAADVTTLLSEAPVYVPIPRKPNTDNYSYILPVRVLTDHPEVTVLATLPQMEPSDPNFPLPLDE